MEIKTLGADQISTALALAERCRSGGQAETAESICTDILEVDPDNTRAIELLLWARVDLLGEGRHGGVERAQEALALVKSDFDRRYLEGVICERQARFLIGKRGRHSSRVAYDWFRHAMDAFEEASRIEPGRPEASLRWNACLRSIERDRHCAPAIDEDEDHGIE
ncbi:hypothetical protein MK489_03265 [Myxococcota bacterium]|nr:hypothetical protein [Myxococcota bacterium]